MVGCSSIEKTSIYGSVARSQVKGEDVYTEITGVRFDLDTTKYTRLPEIYGNFDITLELYGGITHGRAPGHTLGATAMLRYSYPLGRFTPYLEVGAGPTILSVTTYEQEKSGFAFRDQVGIGTEFSITENLSLFAGYRFGHISHAGLRNTRNRGIESDIGILGLTWYY